MLDDTWDLLKDAMTVIRNQINSIQLFSYLFIGRILLTEYRLLDWCAVLDWLDRLVFCNGDFFFRNFGDCIEMLWLWEVWVFLRIARELDWGV